MSGGVGEIYSTEEEVSTSLHLAYIVSCEKAGFTVSSSVNLLVAQIHLCCVNANSPNASLRFRLAMGGAQRF